MTSVPRVPCTATPKSTLSSLTVLALGGFIYCAPKLPPLAHPHLCGCLLFSLSLKAEGVLLPHSVDLGLQSTHVSQKYSEYATVLAELKL